ncbi:FHA domain-containing protein [Sporocytophaga myxococcoides]|uniref:FHA domain-containing protein n=1 Tax=Sporocytophaga myxococcoides TaxID=153721 RepID=UPI000491B0D0|nr:FHA domain-containing protein [Sporocytophaga myxococcoides]
MATVQNVSTGDLVVLSFQHVFGRNPQQCITIHHQDDVSRSHATIFWQTGHWYLKDHSRNGTLFSGEHLRNNVRKLSKNTWFQLGTDDNTKWKIVNLDPPVSYFKALQDQSKIINLSPCTALPNEEVMELQIFHSPLDHKWIVEKNGYTNVIEHGEVLQFENTSWEFIQNDPLEETMTVKAISEFYFLFHLSKDEEHINLSLVFTNQLSVDLESKSCHYILLSLARKRLADMELGLSEEDQGWTYTDDLIKDVSKELGKEVDVYYLNLQIYRVRKQFADYQSYGIVFNHIIQRRTGIIRFGHPYLKIVKEDKVSGAKLPN